MPVFSQGKISEINEQNLSEIEHFINKQSTLVLATSDAQGHPRLSVLNNLPKQNLLRLIFAIKLSTHKTKNLMENPIVEVIYFDGMNTCIIKGKALVSNELKLKKSLWQPWMGKYFIDGAEDLEYRLLVIKPIECRALID